MRRPKKYFRVYRMESKAERARALFMEGYNCSQAVFGAFCEDFGIPFETGMKMVSSLGGGMGRLREVCGAVSAMFLIAGLKDGYQDPKDYEAKAEHYARIQALAEQFRHENGSIICRELLGEQGKDHSPVPGKRTDAYYQKRSCPELVYMAAKMIEETLS